MARTDRARAVRRRDRELAETGPIGVLEDARERGVRGDRRSSVATRRDGSGLELGRPERVLVERPERLGEDGLVLAGRLSGVEADRRDGAQRGEDRGGW